MKHDDFFKKLRPDVEMFTPTARRGGWVGDDLGLFTKGIHWTQLRFVFSYCQI